MFSPIVIHHVQKIIVKFNSFTFKVCLFNIEPECESTPQSPVCKRLRCTHHYTKAISFLINSNKNSNKSFSCHNTTNIVNKPLHNDLFLQYLYFSAQDIYNYPCASDGIATIVRVYTLCKSVALFGHDYFIEIIHTSRAEQCYYVCLTFHRSSM